MSSELIQKIEDRSFVVGIVGLGYVGLPLALAFGRKGFKVLGFDIDEEKTAVLSNGKSYIRHISADAIADQVRGGNFIATADFSRVKECDGILIAVPTPLTKNREPDMTYVLSTCESLFPHMKKGQLFVLESTTFPGTTEELVVPTLEKSGLVCGKDFYVAFSPEREDPNNPDYSTEAIPKVIGAVSAESLEVADKLYSQIVSRTVPVSSTRVAESAKLLENIFRSVNIALVNELKVAFTKMGIDIWEVIEAAKSKPFGFMPFYPGPGLGGHCIPIDPFYLTWKAREYGVATRFIELAGEVNTSMPQYVVTRCMEVLNSFKKPLKGSRVLILGLAYKPNVDDTRESPSFRLMQLLESHGAVVEFNDPYVEVIPAMREHRTYEGKRSKPITSDYDLILISTAHSSYRGIDFAKLGIPVVDTRNLVDEISEKVFQA